MAYFDGYVIPVPADRCDDYRRWYAFARPVFLKHGALAVTECLGEDVPRGEQTDYYRAMGCAEDETVVFGWIEWPDRETRDAGNLAAMAELRGQTEFETLPFDNRRMLFGGFTPIDSDAGE